MDEIRELVQEYLASESLAAQRAEQVRTAQSQVREVLVRLGRTLMENTTEPTPGVVVVVDEVGYFVRYDNRAGVADVTGPLALVP